jgi:NADH:ubiquinone oxidoreductase subunit F (NADH-binding)
MSEIDLLAKIEQAGLVGRGGASFPVHLKWQRIKSVESPKKYVVCNASEGEPGVKKDFYILQNFTAEMIKGIILAMDFLQSKEAYLNINKHYYQKLKGKIDPLLAICQKNGYLINIFEEEPSYIGGETGAILNAIEGKKTEPRPASPSPSLKGIFGNPALVHNVETFYDVARVAAGTFQSTRLATLGGVKNSGVYEVANTQKVADILRKTDNYPAFPFFVQVGGGASGEVMTAKQAEERELVGSGAIEVFSLETKPYEFLSKLFSFYTRESCGKCTPCRDGSWQLQKIITALKPDSEIPWDKITPIIRAMDKSSFCDLGRSIVLPVRSYAKNILRIEV